jgi:hypothetical protein
VQFDFADKFVRETENVEHLLVRFFLVDRFVILAAKLSDIVGRTGDDVFGGKSIE